MKNTIAEHKTSDLIIQVEAMTDKNFIGRVLVGNSCTPVGTYSTWSTAVFNISSNKQKEDKIVTQIVDKFKARSEIGIKKYNTTLEENNTDDFFEHLSEELMDSLLYLQKIKEQKDTYFLLLGRYNELKEQFEKLEKEKLNSVVLKELSEHELASELYDRGFTVTLEPRFKHKF